MKKIVAQFLVQLSPQVLGCDSSILHYTILLLSPVIIAPSNRGRSLAGNTMEMIELVTSEKYIKLFDSKENAMLE